MFSIGLVTADSYMTKPLSVLDASYSEFRGSEVNQVPVIRVFGSLPTGEKACLHIHGVFPYLYVPCVVGELPERSGYRLASALDKALNVSLGCSAATTQHVYSVATMSATPFYGYHSKEQQFLKVSLYNPAMVKRTADLLQSGAVLGRSLKPHYAHVPFLLQFMIDFNLHGMSPVLLERAFFRRPAPAGLEEEMLLPESVLRVSSCEVEADALASAILNPRALHGGVDGNPGLAGIWEEERERRRVDGRGSQPTPHSSQPRCANLTCDELRQHVLLKERLAALKLQEAGSQTHYLLDDQGEANTSAEKVLGNECSSVSQSDEEQQVIQALLYLRANNEATETEHEPEQEAEEEEEQEEDEEEDMSLPLESPHSSQCNIEADVELDDSDVIWENSYWDQFIGRIPQLDGAEDDDDISTYSPVICSGKIGRQCGGKRGREVRQLTNENVMDGTRWSEYRGLLDGLSGLEVNSQQIPSTAGNVVGDCVGFPYDLGLDLDALEVGPMCTAPTPGVFESLPVDTSSGASFTNYSLADMSEDYSNALINDVFLSAISDDATQCTDIQSLAGTDFSSDAGLQIPQSELVLAGEDMLVEEVRRVPIASKTMPGVFQVSKNTPGVIHSCEDGSIFVSACSSSECAQDSIKGFSTKQFDIGPPINNYVMMTNSDGSVNILNAAVASTTQFPKICRENTYVRLVPLSEYRSLALGCESEPIKTTCIERGEAALFSGGIFGAESFTSGRRVVSVDRTTETSPSLLRCSNASVSGRDTECDFLVDANSVGFEKSKSSSKDKTNKVVKFFLKSSLLREKSRDSIGDVLDTSLDSKTQHLKDPDSHSSGYHPALMTKSHSEKSSKLFRCNEQSPPRKVNTFCEPFTKKSKVACERTGSSNKEMERFSRMGVFNSNSRFYDRFTRDTTRPRSAAYHVSSAEDYFLSRKEAAYPKSFAAERCYRRRAVEVQLSPTTSEEDKSLVKLESSPARSRSSPEDHSRLTYFRSRVDRKLGRECRSSDKRVYDPYEFLDEMEEQLSCGSPPSWSRRSTPGIVRQPQPGHVRGGKPASYLQHAAPHRVTFHMTSTSSSTSPTRQAEDDSEVAPLSKCSNNQEASDVDAVVDQIKKEPVWDEEVTSIPKLTLLRAGDSYINFVRLDDDQVSSSTLKQEQPSEDSSIEVAAVKDETEPDTCDSSGSLEQTVVDDRTTLAATSDVCQEMRSCGHFSNDECGEGKDARLEASVSELDASNSSVAIGSGSCEPSRSNTQLLATDHTPRKDSVPIEVVDLSPPSDNVSIEILEVSCSSGDSTHECMDSPSEYSAVEMSSVELEDTPTALDGMLDTVDSAVVVTKPLPVPVLTSATPAAQQCILPSENMDSLICRNKTNDVCETKEWPTQLINSPGVFADSKRAGDVNEQDVLLQGTSSERSEIVYANLKVMSRCKGKFFSNVPNRDAMKNKKVQSIRKIREPRTVKKKKTCFVVNQRSGAVKIREKGGTYKHEKICSKTRNESGSASNALCRNADVGTETSPRLRMRARGTNIGSCAAKALFDKDVKEDTANLHTDVSVPTHANSEQVCTHLQDEVVSKINDKDKTISNSSTQSVPSDKKFMQNVVDESSIDVSSNHECFVHMGDILEQANNSVLNCSQYKSNSEWSYSLPVTPTKSLQSSISSEVCNSDLILGSIGDAGICTQLSKTLRSSRQRSEKSFNASKAVSEPSITHGSPTKNSPRTVNTVARQEQGELSVGDGKHAAPVVMSGIGPVATHAVIEAPPTPRTPSKHVGRVSSRADCKACVDQSPAKGSKKVGSVSTLRHGKRRTLLSRLESEQKLQHADAAHNKTVNIGYKILSVSLSKALPKCKNNLGAAEMVPADLKDGYKSEHDKLSEVDFMPKIAREINIRSKHDSRRYPQFNSGSNSNPTVSPQAKSKKLDVKNMNPKMDDGLRGCKKINSCTEMGIKKRKKCCKGITRVTIEPQQEVSSSKGKNQKINLIIKSNTAGMSNKQSEFETATGSTHAINVSPPENLKISRKRCFIATSASSCTKRKLRKRCGESLCRGNDQNSCSTNESKSESKPLLCTVVQRTNHKNVVKKKAAMKTVQPTQEIGFRVGGRKNNSPRTDINKSSTAVFPQTCKSIDSLNTPRNTLKKQNSLLCVEQFSYKMCGNKVNKVNAKLLQRDMGNKSKLIHRNIGMNGTFEVPLCKTLRNGKKVSNCKVSCENMEFDKNDKLLLQQTRGDKILTKLSPKKAGATETNAIICDRSTSKINKVGRPRKNILKGNIIDEQQRAKSSSESFTEKSQFSKISTRNSAYIKQLRSYTSKQSNEAGLPHSLRNTAVTPTKVRPNKKIPCLDGASGSSSSEEESLINCSQPSSPEPPLKRLREGLVGMKGRKATSVGNNTGIKKSSRRRPSRGKTKCGTPEKGRLAVEIVKSPRRPRAEGVAGTELRGGSPVVVQASLAVGTGLCLPAAEVSSSIGGGSNNSTGQDAELVMKDEIVERSLVPSRTLSEVKPNIVQFNDKNLIYSSACDNVQEETGETVGAINHRSVRKKLDYPVGHQRHQQISGGKQPIKILRRSSLDMFADSSSLSGDTCKCNVETVGVCETVDICQKQSRDDTSSDSEEDEGIISFYETTLLSPAESACSYESLGSMGQLPLSPRLPCSMEPRYRHQEPFYSDPRDVTGPMQVGNIVLHLRSGPVAPQDTVRNVVSPELGEDRGRKRILVPGSPGNDCSDEELILSPVSPGPAHSTPLVSAVRGMKKNDDSQSPLQSLQVSALHRQAQRSQLADSPRPASLCQVAGATPDNTNAFLLSFQNLQEARPITQHTCLTLLSIELHVSTRGKLRPDPHFDPLQAVFYSIYHDVPGQLRYHAGVMVVGTPLQGTGVDCQVESVADEVELLAAVQRLVAKWDPDILAGYEVEMLSWGYLFQRSLVLGMNLCSKISRIPDSAKDSHVASSQEDKARGDTRIAGRILLDVWRLMRHQVTLQSYTWESVAYHVLHQRRPLHSHSCLTAWWDHPSPLYRWMVVEHYLERAHGTVRLLEQLDVLATTSELARLYGIQFHEVLTRGSQFRVESMMLRLAGVHNLVAVSPSVKQRAGMRAPEHLQLIMEPESRFYSDPVIVLDFQSLYPSIIIAYNYCYSTCLGRVQLLGQPGPFKFGCSELNVPLDLIEHLLPDISISPCGVAFVGATTRLGILPRMLQEILHTRLMVKKAMKDHPEDKLLQRVLHARQLGLKLIANVTYGYTAANFSGRMPCVEVGDSVVSKGRETLERAIQLVENTARWQARVVYGDTDSMFVLVAGRSRAQAFEIGAEIAQAVTLDNPAPVKLKLEKVYQPCILQTKKRYVGYAYESPSQEKPTYDAKGIETVRRDGCPAVAKVLEKALRVLFDTRDVSLVKRYVCRQWDKLVQGRANVHDLIFAREYRGRAGYRPGACVPALQLARRWLQVDPRAEPRVGERVPYVIVNGPPAVPLIKLVRSPHHLLADPSLRVNATYYITRVIMPALRRCFSLLGADVDAWYAGMPRRAAPSLPLAGPRPAKCSTISQYFATVNCAVCDQPSHDGLCATCQQHSGKVAAVLGDKLRLWERAHHAISQVCRSCCGRYEPVDCSSLDCPVLFRRSQARRDLLQEAFARQLLARHLPSCDW